MVIYSKISQIERVLQIEEVLLEEAAEVESFFPFRCTSYYANLVRECDFSDPVFSQIFPRREELDFDSTLDPFCEEGSTEHPCLVRRYPNRLLVITTNVCFVHCRFCMRKRKWLDPPFLFEDVGTLVDFLRRHPEVEDVILSGGDPMTLPDALLNELLSAVRSVDTVKIIRIGTRAPVVAPEAVLKKAHVLERFAPVWINTHFNHPRELTDEAAEAVLALIRSGAPVNNQTVLLKGVNDDYHVLKELFVGLLSMGVKPYYLFSCDPVGGVRHFFVPWEKGLGFVERLRREASGMAVPHYAVDGPDGKRIIP